jgi:nanoRNase/pAp phosphatase (c-di-AMP/oligoRNAs hydrolase)
LKIITTHKNMDFDALASVMAANMLYEDARAVLPRTMHPNVRRFLAVHKDVFKSINFKDVDMDSVRAMVVVDACRWDRLETDRAFHEERKTDVSIWDHHPDDSDIDANWRCQRPMGAAVTLLLEELQKRGRSLSPIEATLCLAGIYEDTGSLSFPSTKPEDALAVGFLLGQGADLSIVGEYLRPAYGKTQKEILFTMLDSSESFAINGFDVSISKIAIEGHTPSLAVVVNMYREIVNTDAAFGIFSVKENGRSFVIGRSREGGVNIGEIMRGLGGGGHAEAGSAMVKDAAPEKIEEIIRERIQNYRRIDVSISDLMSFPVFSVPPDMPMRDVAEVLLEHGCTGLPIIEDDALAGVISKRDFGKRLREKDWNKPVKAFMQRDVVTLTPGDSAEKAVRLITRHDIGRLPVVENDRVIGIVTRTDLMRYFYDLLPS